MSDITEGAQIFQQGARDLGAGLAAYGDKKAKQKQAEAESQKQAYIGEMLSQTPEGQTAMGQVGAASVGLGLAKPWDVAGDMMKMDPVKMMTLMGRDALIKNDPKLQNAFNNMMGTYMRISELEAFSKAKGSERTKAMYGGGSGGGSGGGGGDFKGIYPKPIEGSVISQFLKQKYPNNKMTIKKQDIPGATEDIVIDLNKDVQSQLSELTSIKKGWVSDSPAKLTVEQAFYVNRYYMNDLNIVTADALKSVNSVYRNPAAAPYLNAESASIMNRIAAGGIDGALFTVDGDKKKSKVIPLNQVDKRLFYGNEIDNTMMPASDFEQKVSVLVQNGAPKSLIDSLYKNPARIDSVISAMQAQVEQKKIEAIKPTKKQKAAFNKLKTSVPWIPQDE